MMKNNLKIVAIIPAYNEEKHISKVISLTKKYVDFVIVVDDGSSDKTFDIAKASCEGTDFVLRHPINSGKGVALYTGFILAEREEVDVIITIDADLQHDASQIPEFVSCLLETKSDLVIGCRKSNRKMPFVFKFGNFVLNTTFRLLYGKKINDTQSGFRAFKSGVFSKIAWNSSGYVVETEMLAAACKKKLKISEISIATQYHDNYKGTTIFDGIKIFIQMLSWRVF